MLELLEARCQCAIAKVVSKFDEELSNDLYEDAHASAEDVGYKFFDHADPIEFWEDQVGNILEHGFNDAASSKFKYLQSQVPNDGWCQHDIQLGCCPAGCGSH